MFTGAFGCGSFLLGALLAAFLFAPRILGDSLARVAEGVISERVDGEVRIEGLRLYWTETQRIHGITVIDPRGREVMSLHATLPSLLQIVRLEPGPLTFGLEIVLADIVIDESGVSNLARALGSAGEPKRLARLLPEASGERIAIDLPGLSAEFEPAGAWRFELRARDVRWSDLRGAGARVGIPSVALALDHGPDGSLVGEVSGRTEGERIGAFEASFGFGRRDGSARASVLEGRSSVEAFPTPLAAFLLRELVPGAGRPEAVADVLGDTLGWDARALEDGDGALRVAGSVDSKLGPVAFEMSYAEGVLRGPREVELRSSAGWSPGLEAALIALFPWFDSLEVEGSSAAMRASITDVEYAPGAGNSVAKARIDLELPRLRYRLTRTFADSLHVPTEEPGYLFGPGPLALAVERGSLRYPELALVLEGRPSVLRGTYDWTTGALDLAVEAPLALVGRQIGLDPRVVEMLRETSLAPPILVHGTAPAPITSIDTAVVRQMVQGSLREALREGTRAVLGKTIEVLRGEDP